MNITAKELSGMHLGMRATFKAEGKEHDGIITGVTQLQFGLKPVAVYITNSGGTQATTLACGHEITIQEGQS